jgi:hypothetical protein
MSEEKRKKKEKKREICEVSYPDLVDTSLLHM